MKKLHLLVTSITMALMFSINVSASTHDVEINGQTVQVETIGNVQVVDINDPLYDLDYSNGELINGKIVYTAPESQKSMLRSVGSFSFTINDKVTTNFEYSSSSTWNIATKAKLYNKETKVKYTSSDHYYIVSIMQDIETPIFSYRGKADDIKGGVKFTNVPKGTNLAIQVRNDTELPNTKTYLDGSGTTTFR